MDRHHNNKLFIVSDSTNRDRRGVGHVTNGVAPAQLRAFSNWHNARTRMEVVNYYPLSLFLFFFQYKYKFRIKAYWNEFIFFSISTGTIYILRVFNNGLNTLRLLYGLYVSYILDGTSLCQLLTINWKLTRHKSYYIHYTPYMILWVYTIVYSIDYWVVS